MVFWHRHENSRLLLMLHRKDTPSRAWYKQFGYNAWYLSRSEEDVHAGESYDPN
jgi:hypothetical protein